MNTPDDRIYTENHLWFKIDQAQVIMGVTEPLVRHLEPILWLEVPEPDAEMMTEIPFGELEGKNETVQLYPPAEAAVLETNEAVAWDPSKLEEDPYGDGWLLKIKVHDPDALRSLMQADTYEEYCEQELQENDNNE
jgi:glycine cleavage system H protein